MTPSSSVQEKGLENVTVAEILMAKGGESTGPWLWCNSNDAVSDAAKNMAKNNIGSLVVLKPGQPLHVAGIITERDYLRKIVLAGRSPVLTRVSEIMTDEKNLITVSSDTNILQAMQLMT
ncbi:CBS domain-containing protein CBSX3, mitochondrial-like, partial [Morus notabilis]